MIFRLQLGFSPIRSGDHVAARGATATAFHFVRLVVGHRVIERQFLAGGDIPNRDKNDLPLQT
ncbi:MAG: hypothetical protein KGL75_00760 [Acidobacteriota bacterium]|nr:hypothetical protein [Acidobacteriota bacterium]